MHCAERFAIVALVVLALAPARADEPGRSLHAGAESQHACLNQKERRTEIESGRVIRLAAAIRAAKQPHAGHGGSCAAVPWPQRPRLCADSSCVAMAKSRD